MTQPLTALQLSTLHADLHHLRVASRQQGNRNLSYLEAYDVRATLIRVFGYGNWSGETLETRVVHESQYPSPDNADRMLWRIGVVCTYRITIHQTGAIYTESAAASQSGPDYGEVLDFAIKTAESDALKRCATNLGTTFGLSLYDGGKLADVVRTVYAPDQWEVVEDLKAARSGGEDAAAARARMQARLKTGNPAGQGSSSGSSAAEGSPEPAGSSGEETAPAEEPTVAEGDPVEQPLSPANEGPGPDVPPDPNEAVPAAKDHVKQAAADLARVVAGKPPRARAKAAEAVAS